jgi:hypothetical protein
VIGGRSTTRRRTWISITILAVVYLSLALTFSLLTRAWEANDEPDHVQYIEFILHHGAIPRISPSNGDESHQPPLYYLLGAGWQRILGIPFFSNGFNPVYSTIFGTGLSVPPLAPAASTDTTGLVYRHNYTPRQHRVAVWLHELRLLSVIFGLGTVLLAYACAKIVRAGEGMAFSVGLFVALLPKELVVTSVVSNDALVITLCSAAIACYLLAERARTEGRWRQRHISMLGMGLLLGAAAITKFNSLPVAAILLVLAAWPAVRILLSKYVSHNDSAVASLRRPCADVVLAGAAFFAVSGWWFVRNDQLYGSVLATRAAQKYVGLMTGNIYHPTHSYVNLLVKIVPDQLYKSVWYDGGWNGLQLPVWVNAVLAVFGVLSFAAGTWALLQRRSFGGLQAAGLLGSVVGALVATVLVGQSTSHVEGRIAFVGLCAFALIATIGTQVALGRVGRPWTGLLVWPAILLALDVYVLVHFTVPLAGL